LDEFERESEDEDEEFRVTPRLYSLFPTASFRELGIDTSRDTYSGEYTVGSFDLDGDIDSFLNMQRSVNREIALSRERALAITKRIIAMRDRAIAINTERAFAIRERVHAINRARALAINRATALALNRERVLNRLRALNRERVNRERALNRERPASPNAVDRAAAQARIRGLDDVTISKIHTSKSEQCAVCLEYFRMRQNVKGLPCRHIFHSHCIIPWLEERCTCPSCRKYVDIRPPPMPIPIVRRRSARNLARQSAGNQEQAGPSTSNQEPANIYARNVGCSSARNENRSRLSGGNRRPTGQSGRTRKPRGRSTKNKNRKPVNNHA
ncbi:E3 ubiquitin-protein ligase RNF126-like, partial [Stegodyphus dumicola]|uniref:E3 ubiquitin-protein ligase RNF126-like n=1 Tax=Stegodyphus dumicola TaxID=202533 RepID=UPI0015B1681E